MADTSLLTNMSGSWRQMTPYDAHNRTTAFNVSVLAACTGSLAGIVLLAPSARVYTPCKYSMGICTPCTVSISTKKSSMDSASKYVLSDSVSVNASTANQTGASSRIHRSTRACGVIVGDDSALLVLVGAAVLAAGELLHVVYTGAPLCKLGDLGAGVLAAGAELRAVVGLGSLLVDSDGPLEPHCDAFSDMLRCSDGFFLAPSVILAPLRAAPGAGGRLDGSEPSLDAAAAGAAFWSAASRAKRLARIWG